MIAVGLKNQLGNQMFQYSAVKTIAERKGFEFKCYFVPTEKKYVNSIDSKYGSYVGTLFEICPYELLDSAPNLSNLYNENNYSHKNDFKKSFYTEAININDDTIVNGHFESIKYFYDNISSVRQWFKFHNDTKVTGNEVIRKLRNAYDNRPLVSVHFRVGNDFTTHGYTLGKKYWTEAAKKIQQKLENPIFVCFYDKLNATVKYFMNKFDCTVLHGSLIEDMYVIHCCDGHIVCNSTYSIMSSLLDAKNSLTICPSCYPVTNAYKELEDYFPPEWERVKAKRSMKASIYNVLQYINIRWIKI